MLQHGNTAEVRLLRFWEARNINKGGELMSLDILLINENMKSKACEASKFVSKHGTTYCKQFLEKNRQYIQEPDTVEKCQELSKQLPYTRLASFLLAVKIKAFMFMYVEPVRWANKPPKIKESRVSISSDISSDMYSRGDNNAQDDMPGAGEVTTKPYKLNCEISSPCNNRWIRCLWRYKGKCNCCLWSN
ncbi:hypothetical protein Bca52824_067470 [Brassica carinata]|uniref:Uncharacterized protein n=1 Tax=Brassica carinata TaxID=52824 RepID=A0A8X7QM06_BRACI|nr:hypothetical protein Bca52824_067470 [Brassica carinata]